MKEYVITLCAAALMVSICGIILPEGNIKKYATLSSSVIISLAILLPLGSITDFSHVWETESIETEDAERKYAEILSGAYEETIEKALEHLGRIHVYADENMKVKVIEIYTSSEVSEEDRAFIEETYKPEKLEVHYEIS